MERPRGQRNVENRGSVRNVRWWWEAGGVPRGSPPRTCTVLQRPNSTDESAELQAAAAGPAGSDGQTFPFSTAVASRWRRLGGQWVHWVGHPPAKTGCLLLRDSKEADPPTPASKVLGAKKIWSRAGLSERGQQSAADAPSGGRTRRERMFSARKTYKDRDPRGTRAREIRAFFLRRCRRWWWPWWVDIGGYLSSALARALVCAGVRWWSLMYAGEYWQTLANAGGGRRR